MPFFNISLVSIHLMSIAPVQISINNQPRSTALISLKIWGKRSLIIYFIILITLI